MAYIFYNNLRYLPWILKNCSIISSGSDVYNQSVNSRIYVHNPVYWEDSEITRAVTCESTPGVYFNNTGKCEFSEDTLFNVISKRFKIRLFSFISCCSNFFKLTLSNNFEV